MAKKTAADFANRDGVLELAQKWADAYAAHGSAGSITEYYFFRQALDTLLDPDHRGVYLEGPLTRGQIGAMAIMNVRVREVAHPGRPVHEKCAACSAAEKALDAWFAAHLVDEGPPT